MWFVKIKNASFFAKHGMYEQEKILGNSFVVNVSIGFDEQFIEHINQTIDYVLIYQIIENEMAIPRKLLEEVMSRIMQTIENQFKQIKYCKLSIQKLNPAFGKQIEATEVEIEKKY